LTDGTLNQFIDDWKSPCFDREIVNRAKERENHPSGERNGRLAFSRERSPVRPELDSMN
jgi:hypothetical protein